MEPTLTRRQLLAATTASFGMLAGFRLHPLWRLVHDGYIWVGLEH